MTLVCHGGEGDLEALSKMLTWANKGGGECKNKKCWQGGRGV